MHIRREQAGVAHSGLSFATTSPQCLHPAHVVHQVCQPDVEVRAHLQFLMRGLENIGIEWDLVTISYNISRMFTLKNLSLSRI